MGILESMNIGGRALRTHGLRLDVHSKILQTLIRLTM